MVFTDKQAYEAYAVIRNVCRSQNSCTNCPYDLQLAGCAIRVSCPHNWDEPLYVNGVEYEKDMEINGLKDQLAMKDRYIAKLETQITNVKEILKND